MPATTHRSLRSSSDAKRAALKAWAGTFYPFQRKWLADDALFSLTLKARQIGRSHTAGAQTVTWALGGETSTIVSTSERDAFEVLDKAEKHAKVLHALGLAEAYAVKKGVELRFPRTAGRIIALPNSSGGRGFSGNVILDEFAYYDNAEEVWDAASGATTLGYKLHVMSTPNGVGNLFHTLAKNALRDGWTLHRVTIQQAIEAGYPVDLDACWKRARGDQRVFDQLYSCAFLDSDLQYFSSKLLDAVTVDNCAMWDGLLTYAGLDVGRINDRTTLIILREYLGVLWPQAVITRPRTADEDFEDLCALTFYTYGARRLCIDATGIGAFPAERMVKKWGETRVEPVEFTLPLKEDLMTGLFSRFVEQTIRLDRAYPEVIQDLLAIRRIITTAGNVRYDAAVGPEGHADAAWALALANHAATRPSSTRHETNR